MKYINYELCISFIMPCFWYEEGMPHEIYYVDEQTCDYQHFGLNHDNEIKNKWYKIMLYKPKGMTITGTENSDKCKWLVSESYSDYLGSDDDTDYEKYEWDFKNHCIKL